MTDETGNRTTDEAPESPEAAMNRVLEAEQAAARAIRECEEKATAILQAAQQRARRIASRTDERIARINQRTRQRLQLHLTELERAGQQEDLEQADDRRAKLVAGVVNGLAAGLTGSREGD